EHPTMRQVPPRCRQGAALVRCARWPRCRHRTRPLCSFGSTSRFRRRESWHPPPWFSNSACAEQVLRREVLQAHEAEAIAAEIGVSIKILPRTAVGDQLLDRLALAQGRL